MKYINFICFLESESNDKEIAANEKEISQKSEESSKVSKCYV